MGGSMGGSMCRWVKGECEGSVWVLAGMRVAVLDGLTNVGGMECEREAGKKRGALMVGGRAGAWLAD